MKVHLACDDESGEYYLSQFAEPLTAASFQAPPRTHSMMRTVDMPDHVVDAYVQHMIQHRSLQYFLSLLDETIEAKQIAREDPRGE